MPAAYHHKCLTVTYISYDSTSYLLYAKISMAMLDHRFSSDSSPLQYTFDRIFSYSYLILLSLYCMFDSSTFKIQRLMIQRLYL